LLRNASISYRLLLAMAGRLRRLTGRMEDAAFLDVHARLAKRLLELADGRTPGADGWVALTARLSQRELGGAVGATRESVNKPLKLLTEAEAVQKRGAQLLIAPARLRTFIASL